MEYSPGAKSTANRSGENWPWQFGPLLLRSADAKAACADASVALAWHFAKGVTAPIIGATKPGHIDAACAAMDLALTEDEVRRLEEPYLPKNPVGVASTVARDWSLTIARP